MVSFIDFVAFISIKDFSTNSSSFILQHFINAIIMLMHTPLPKHIPFTSVIQYSFQDFPSSNPCPCHRLELHHLLLRKLITFAAFGIVVLIIIVMLAIIHILLDYEQLIVVHSHHDLIQYR